MYALKEAIDRSEAHEKRRRGRHGDIRHSRALEQRLSVSDCRMIAHAPQPSTAAPMPTTAPTTVAAISRVSSARKARSRASRDSWIVDTDVSRNVTESAVTSGLTWGSP